MWQEQQKVVEDFTDVSRSKALQIYTVVVESVESLHGFFRKPRQTSNKLSTPVRIVVSYRDKPVPYCDRRTIRQSRKHFARKADFALVTDKRLAVQYSTVINSRTSRMGHVISVRRNIWAVHPGHRTNFGWEHLNNHFPYEKRPSRRKQGFVWLG